VALTRAQAVAHLAVALDTSERDEVVRLTRVLAGRAGTFKVGLEAFTAHGPDLVREVRDLGAPVFLDLKLHDIPNTVERAARNAARLGAAMFTVHASGGEAMLRAAVAGAADAERPPAVLAVTVLTSLDDAALEGLGIPGGAAGRVRAWAEMARRAGCAGVVCSPQEAAALRAALGAGFLLVTPGIRPAGAASADQRRVATPQAAVEAGADVLVVGRPITGAADPAAAAEAILAELCAP
jgi:orotidine-5'-phosphate decarboxylase